MDRIELLYEKQGYFAKYSSDIWISLLILVVSFIIICYNAYKSVLTQIKSNWNEHKCSPIYLPFAGLIMPEKDKSAIETTIENFEYCLQTDISSIFGIIMMPIEFAIYVTVDCIDGITTIFVALATFVEYLKSLLSGIFAEIFNKILYIIIPLIVMMLKIRDSSAKTSGVLVASIQSVINFLNLTTSIMSTLLTIVLDVIAWAIGIFYGLITIGIILCLSFFGMSVGLTTIAIALGIATGAIIPIIKVYISLINVIQEIMPITPPGVPGMPNLSIKRKKK